MRAHNVGFIFRIARVGKSSSLRVYFSYCKITLQVLIHWLIFPHRKLAMRAHIVGLRIKFEIKPDIYALYRARDILQIVIAFVQTSIYLIVFHLWNVFILGKKIFFLMYYMPSGFTIVVIFQIIYPSFAISIIFAVYKVIIHTFFCSF